MHGNSTSTSSRAQPKKDEPQQEWEVPHASLTYLLFTHLTRGPVHTVLFEANQTSNFGPMSENGKEGSRIPKVIFRFLDPIHEIMNAFRIQAGRKLPLERSSPTWQETQVVQSTKIHCDQIFETKLFQMHSKFILKVDSKCDKVGYLEIS